MYIYPTDKCDFNVNPENSREYKPKDNGNMKFATYLSCSKYFSFDLKTCTCKLDNDGMYCLYNVLCNTNNNNMHVLNLEYKYRIQM